MHAEGDARFRVERQRVEELPTFAQASDAVIGEIAAEQREDQACDSRAITMMSDGALRVHGVEMGVEPSAFRQLATLTGFGGGTRYLTRSCGPELRSLNVNAQLQRGVGRDVVLRTREARGRRQIYAAVTPTYAALDTHRVLEHLRPAIGPAHTEARYDGSGVSSDRALDARPCGRSRGW